MKPGRAQSDGYMKKFITLVIACALALAASARSQQNDDQQTKKRARQEESAAAHNTPPNSQSQRPAARRHLTPGMQEPAATTPRDWPRNHPGSVPQEKREQNPQSTPAIDNPSVA